MSIEDTRQVDDGDLPEGDEQVWDFLERLGREARDCASGSLPTAVEDTTPRRHQGTVC